jgi:hypothetical protein
MKGQTKEVPMRKPSQVCSFPSTASRPTPTKRYVGATDDFGEDMTRYGLDQLLG